MRNRGRHRRLQGVGPPSGPPLTGNDILTITDNGSDLPLVTTAAPHGLSSEDIVISGTSNANYHTTFPQNEAPPSATTFVLGGFLFSELGPATGGRWDLV